MANHDEFQTQTALLRQLPDLRNDKAWRTFLQRYRPMMERWGRRQGLRHDQAEEVTARVLEKLVRKIGRYVRRPERGRFRGWLKAVVCKEVRDFRRTLRRKPDQQGNGATVCLELVPDLNDLDELSEELEAQVRRYRDRLEQLRERVRQRVDPHTWEAYRRTAEEGQAAAEVAAALAMTQTAVGVAKFRVAKRLREEWERMQGEGPG